MNVLVSLAYRHNRIFHSDINRINPAKGESY
jgi:hypothetical protein